MAVIIYALIDPLTNECRYVGKTINVTDRYWLHCNPPSHYNTYSARWIRSIRPQKPTLVELEYAGDDWAESETWWIAYMRSLGARLTNISPGGEGGRLGFKHSDETRMKLSAINKGRKLTPEWRSNVIKALIGRQTSAETRDKISKALKNLAPEKRQRITDARSKQGGNFRTGTKCSPETVAKIAEFHRGKKRSEQSRQRMREAQLGKKHSEETKAKRSIALKLSWAERKARK